MGLDLAGEFFEFHGALLEFECAFLNLQGFKNIHSMQEDIGVLHHWMRRLRSVAICCGATCPDCGGPFECCHDLEVVN